jgi:cytochrome c oxidase subunit II
MATGDRGALQNISAARDAGLADCRTLVPEAKALKHVLGIAATIVIVLTLFATARGDAGGSAARRLQAPNRQREKPPRIISVSAKNFEFDPAVIHMKVDERVELDVTSEDRTHGIRISAFPDGAKTNTAPGLSFPNGEDCYKLKAGEMVAIGIVPTEPGTYNFSCCKLCGSGHKRMKGQIIVDR